MSMEAVTQALAEPRRREILRLVRDVERPVNEIAAHFSVTRPAISQHLRVLHDAGLVDIRPDGNRRLYRARPEGMAELRTWIESFWRASLADLKIEVERDLWNQRKERSRHDR